MDVREHGTASERPLTLAPERFSRTGRPAYAIIDIGSNSVRLVVYDEIGRAPFPRFNEKALCQLGDGLARTGALTPDGIARTLAALRRFRAIADAMAVGRIDVARHRSGAAGEQRPGPGRPDHRADRPAGTGPERRGGGLFRRARRRIRVLPADRAERRHGRGQPGNGGCPR